jgi:phospholipid/cholesterol/gamma-HCH transport system substrate-binding protein
VRVRERIRRRASRITAFQAGLIAIVVTTISVYLAFGGSLPWESSFELRAVVTSANQLHSRTPVRIAGIDVGRVESIKRGPGRLATVTMSLSDNGLPIHSDATLKVRPRIFLEGNFFIDLQPGTPSAPLVKSGHLLPVSQTAIPVQLDQVLDVLRRGTRENLASLVHELAVTLDKGGADAFKQSLPYWQPLFLNAAIAAEATRGVHQHDLSGSIAGLERLAGTLARHRTQLASLISGLDVTVEALASQRTALAASVPEFDALLRQAGPTFVTLNALFPTAREFVAAARPGLRAAPATLEVANPLLGELQGLLSPQELPELIRVGTPAIRTLARAQPHLRTILRLLLPVTECARRDVIPTLKTPVQDPPHTTGDPPYRELLHGWVGLASQAQNFTGDGPAIRYHAGFGDQSILTGTIPQEGQQLVGITENKLLGSRPKFTNVQPPLKPNAPCAKQKRPNLHADTGPAEQ